MRGGSTAVRSNPRHTRPPGRVGEVARPERVVLIDRPGRGTSSSSSARSAACLLWRPCVYACIPDPLGVTPHAHLPSQAQVAREEGASWQKIADALTVSRQSAHSRWAGTAEDAGTPLAHKGEDEKAANIGPRGRDPGRSSSRPEEVTVRMAGLPRSLPGLRLLLEWKSGASSRNDGAAL
jgi:hypothetical protein